MLPPVSGYTDSGFTALGSSVYWIRQVGSDVSLYGADGISGARHLAGGMSSNAELVDVNSQSVLIRGFPDLYRIPLPNGLGSASPAVVVSGASANIITGTEDSNALYWVDSTGTMYKCSVNNLGNCAANKILVTSGQPIAGNFYQDSQFLYWGIQSPSQVVRMAK